MVTMVPSFIIGLDDLGGLDRHLVRELGNGDRLRHRHFAHHGSLRARRVAAVVVAMAPAHLRAAPSRSTCGAAGVAAQLERARRRGFFLEHLAGRLLGRTIAALVALLRRRAVQRAFLLRVGGGRRLLAFRGRFRPRLPRPWPPSSASRSFFVLRAASRSCFSLSSSCWRLESACALRDSSSRAAISLAERCDGAAATGARAQAQAPGRRGFDDRRRRDDFRFHDRRRRDFLDRRRNGRGAPLRPRGARAHASCGPRPESLRDLPLESGGLDLACLLGASA
jgi:hypothetical protein